MQGQTYSKTCHLQQALDPALGVLIYFCTTIQSQ